MMKLTLIALVGLLAAGTAYADPQPHYPPKKVKTIDIRYDRFLEPPPDYAQGLLDPKPMTGPLKEGAGAAKDKRQDRRYSDR